MFKIIIAVVIVTIIGLFIMTKIDPTNNTSNIINSGKNTAEIGSGDLDKVEISGQILHPGDYYIASESTLGDLINKAGGVLENADPHSYTPGLLIGIRTFFYISPKADIPESCTVKNIDKANINTATAEELKAVGFSSAQSQAIIDYRNKNGYFSAIEDIINVSGIGDKTYLSVRDKICLA
jgi:competence protein ComEA